VVWAVVSAKTADAVERDWRRTVQRRLVSQRKRTDTAPVATAAAEVGALRSPGTYHLVQYDGSNWKPGLAITTDYVAGERTWLAMGPDRGHLLWQPKAEDVRIEHALWDGERWELQSPLELDAPPQVGVARLVSVGDEAQLLFAVLTEVEGEPEAWHFRAWKWLAGERDSFERGWSSLPGLKSAEGKEPRLPAGAAVASFLDGAGEGDPVQAWAILSGSGESVQLRMWSLSRGELIRAPTDVFIGEEDGGSRQQQSVRDMVGLLTVFLLFMLVFWRRQESLARPIALPPGYVVANLGKRAVAAMVDLSPAMGVVWWIWHAEITAYINEIQDSVALGVQPRVTAPVQVLLIWVYFCLMYTGYCLVFESISQSTPGKRLMGCEVLSESMEKPNRVQIVVRNVMRLVELEKHLLIWPFLLMVFFTRNRQRFGDLVARTVVVERCEILSDMPSGLEEEEKAEDGGQETEDREGEGRSEKLGRSKNADSACSARLQLLIARTSASELFSAFRADAAEVGRPERILLFSSQTAVRSAKKRGGKQSRAINQS
jgi:uncharacterized RDD family membrane protein YckC